MHFGTDEDINLSQYHTSSTGLGNKCGESYKGHVSPQYIERAAMLNAVLATANISVCLSVRHTAVLCQNE